MTLLIGGASVGQTETRPVTVGAVRAETLVDRLAGASGGNGGDAKPPPTTKATP